MSNAKKYQVLSRCKCDLERAEMKAFGITDADDWTPAHGSKLTINRATDLRLRLERIGHETVIVDVSR